MLYTNGNCSIKLRGGTSPRFHLNQGVRQGCPIIPYSFLIAVQFLNLHIKQSSLQGMNVVINLLRLSQLADDPVFIKELIKFLNTEN